MKAIITLALITAAAMVAADPGEQPPGPIDAALAHPARPAADRERDAGRKPGQVLAFFGIEPGMRVEVPLEIDVRDVRSQVATALSLDANGRGHLVADRCNAVALSDLGLAAEQGALNLTLDLDMDFGTRVFGRCVGPRDWRGQALIRIEPAVAEGGLSISFRAESAELRRPDGGTGLLTRPSRVLAERLILPRVETVRLDLAPALVELDALLQTLLAGSGPAVEKLAQRSRLDRVGVGGLGLIGVLALEVDPPDPAAGPAAALDPSELAQWQRLEDELDGFLTAVIVDLAGKAGDRELRLDLLGVMIDSRIAIAEALVRDDRGSDPVRDLFIQSWDRLRPRLTELAASGALSGDEGLRLASFVAGADAIAALDALGADYGVEISRDGLRRLARLLLTDPVPAEFTPLNLAVDPRLRALFGFPADPAPAPPSAGRRLLEALFPAAHASAPSIVETLRRMIPGPNTLLDYLALVSNLLDEAARSHLADRTRIPEAFRPLLDPLLRATAWKESCWRHYLRADPTPEVIRSPVGAVGMMQINARVWRGVYDLALLESDVRYNVGAGIDILEHYFVDYALRRGEHDQPGGADNLVRATYAAYNGGPGQLARYRRESTPRRLKSIDHAFWQLYEQMMVEPWPAESSCYSF